MKVALDTNCFIDAVKPDAHANAAKKRVTTVERRGRNADTLSQRVEIPLGRRSAYGRTSRKVGEQFSSYIEALLLS